MTETQTNNAPTSTSKNKPRQGRSPAFPFIPIGKALERAETFRVAEGGRPKHFSPLTSAFKAWGLGAKTGPAQQTVAAMGHYGLFEFQGSGDSRSARLTSLAFGILLDSQPTSPERDGLVRKAALKPAIHAELWQKWQSTLPSDPTLETYLVRDRGFSEGGARALIAVYKDTIAFANLSQPASIPGNVSDDTFNVGDYVNWESQGQTQWQKPWKVVEVAAHEDGEHFLRVEGTDEDADKSGWIPMNEAVHQDAAAIESAGGGPKFRPPPKATTADAPTPKGARREVFALDEGDVVLIYPDELSEDSYGDLDGYLKLFLKKARRRAGVPEPNKNGPKEQDK